jgi:hypothetical protein
MSLSFQFTEKVAIAGTSITQNTTITNDARQSLDVAAVPIAADQLHALVVDVSQDRGCFILSDQNLTLETNSPSAPGNTLTLVANIPYVWYTDKYDALKFTVDITALYVTNASAATAHLQIEFLIDPTV